MGMTLKELLTKGEGTLTAGEAKTLPWILKDRKMSAGSAPCTRR